ncbi:YdcF family protein [Acidocella sp.]|uniref:YdcF family protein n=1 Tax=Acidocella sp. TaxID=50710 RepID=UPI003CFF42C6
MPRLFRRRRFSPFRLFARLLLAVAGAWSAGFLIYLAAVFMAAPPNPLPLADGIVVLTGGDDRIREALKLLAAHEAPLLLISGAGKGTYLGDFTQDDSSAATRYASAITVGHMATTTHANGTETANWARAHHMHSLIVVTADYHMPRALVEIGRALPGVRLIPDPVRPPAMRDHLAWPTLRMLAGEYSKYLVVRAGLGSLFSTGSSGDY